MIPSIITHDNMEPLLEAINREPYFQCGSKAPYDPKAWYWNIVALELPAGELCECGLKTLALTGFREPIYTGLTGKEGFASQGLEGKVIINKPLFNCLMNLRDLIPRHRGRIVVPSPKGVLK